MEQNNIEFRIDPNTAYDVVELPSKGIHYSNKKKSVRVAYLTASDENILTSVNLMQSNKIVDELLKRKILDKDLNIDDLDEEDKKAILIFLRNTAFGSEYSVTLNDPKTNEPFDYIFNLDNITIKDFDLIENEHGEYTYFLEKSNVNITFKFLTKKQQTDIEKLNDSWTIDSAPPIITKQLEYMIKSINGNRDTMSISNFIKNLPIKDSKDFRKFVLDNKPGIKLEQETTTPSGEKIQFNIGFGVEFFRPFFGI
jgi:hypothetical protein